jgi:hypothetical protein
MLLNKVVFYPTGGQMSQTFDLTEDELHNLEVFDLREKAKREGHQTRVKSD